MPMCWQGGSTAPVLVNTDEPLAPNTSLLGLRVFRNGAWVSRFPLPFSQHSFIFYVHLPTETRQPFATFRRLVRISVWDKGWRRRGPPHPPLLWRPCGFQCVGWLNPRSSERLDRAEARISLRLSSIPTQCNFLHYCGSSYVKPVNSKKNVPM